MADPLTKETGITPPAPVQSPRRMVSQRPSLGPRRQSRFTEETMSERTPASSISIRSFEPPLNRGEAGPMAPVRVNTNNTQTTNADTVDFGPVQYSNTPLPPVAVNAEERGPLPVEKSLSRASWLRILSSVLHVVPCLVLLYIMGESIRVLRGNWASQTSVQGILLLSFLYLDTILDVIALFRTRKPWPTWRLLLRTGFGVAYLVLFFVYIGFGRVFPEGYAYWGVSSEMAGPLVYIFLWWIGIWNLLHIPACRYHLVSCLRKNRSAARTEQRRRPSMVPSELHPTSFNPRVSTVGTDGGASSISLTWRRWVRTHSTSYSHDGAHDLEFGLQRPRTRTTVGEGASSADVTLRGEEGEGVEHQHVEDVEKSRKVSGKPDKDDYGKADDNVVSYSNKKDEEAGQRSTVTAKAVPPPRAEEIGQ